MGQQPQLNLGVICVYQHVTGGCAEHLAHLCPQGGAHGNVLQIGLGGGKPPGGSDGVLEAGVDTSVRGDDFAKSLYIGGVELGQLPVLQNMDHDLMVGGQLFQYLRIGGIAGLGLFYRGQAQLVK